MNARTRMLALSAAAKVTLVGVFACEKAPMVTAETARGPMPTEDASVHFPPAPPTPTAPTATLASECGVGAESAPTEAALQCCRSAISALTTAMRKPSSPDEVACCSAMARANDERIRATGGGFDMSDRYACCEVLGWQGSMTCTPWGPPMPPEIDSLA